MSNQLLCRLINHSEFVGFSLAYECNLKELQKLDQEGFEKYNEWCNFRDYFKAFSFKKSVREDESLDMDELCGSDQYGPIWTMSYRNRDYSVWLKNLLINGCLKSGLVKDPILLRSIPFLDKHLSICEELVPYVFLKLIMERSVDDSNRVKLGRYIAQFFARLDSEISLGLKKSIKLLIGVVEFIIENSIKRSK